MTGPTLRWAVAAAVTIAAFAAVTWACGAFVLPMRDGEVRWGIAGGLGVAVAALAALWGSSYATAGHVQPAAEAVHDAPADAGTGSTSNEISGGNFHGPVFQGRDIGPFNPPTTRRPPSEGLPMAHHSDEDVSNTISGGIFLSAVIQGKYVTVNLPPEISTAMNGLRAASPTFTGRDSDLDEILQVLAPRHAEEDADGPAATCWTGQSG